MNPSSSRSSDGSWAISTSTSVGLVRTFVLETTGQTKGLVLDRKYKTGTSGSAYFEGTVAYDTASMTITNESVVRPVVDERRVYTEAITTGTSGSHLTTYTPDWYGGAGEVLMLEEMLTTQPSVATGNNGSGSANTSNLHFTKQGRKDWEEHEDGCIDYYDWSDGVLVKTVKDVSSTYGTSPPAGWTASADGIDRQDDSTFDAQGRKVQTTLADGNIQRRYVSKLKDERVITLDYAHYASATPSFYGPVRFSVRNLAGKVEASGTVGLTSDVSTSAQTAH
ncbi:MAG: hypothetical protein GY708_18020, partial [Actinomycetia bacterium]|nr:hypothetical protein [Actinomycetes bacterium]